jgi:hypothetical protein
VKRIRLALAAGLAAATVMTMPALGQPTSQRSGVLTVSAPHTASTQVRLLSRVHIDAEKYAFGVPQQVLAKAGHYGGLVIYKGSFPVFGLIVDASVAAPMVFGQVNPRLNPGVYTVVVIGDKHVRINLPLTGGGYSYALQARAGAHVRRVSAQGSLAGPVGLGYTTAPVKLWQASTIAFAYSVQTNSSQASRIEVCLSDKAQPCAPTNEREGFDFVLLTPGSIGGGYSVEEMFAYPGDIGAGSYYGVGDDQNLGVTKSARLVCYVIG